LKGGCVDVSKELKIGNLNMNESFYNNNFHKIFNTAKDRKSILDIKFMCIVLYTLLFNKGNLNTRFATISLFTMDGFKFFKFKSNGLGGLN